MQWRILDYILDQKKHIFPFAVKDITGEMFLSWIN